MQQFNPIAVVSYLYGLLVIIACIKTRQRHPLKNTVRISRDTMVGSASPQRESAFAYSFPVRKSCTFEVCK